MASGAESFDGELGKHVEGMPDIPQGKHDHTAGKWRKTPEVSQLKIHFPLGFRELEQAVEELDVVRGEIIALDSNKLAIVDVRVQNPKEVKILVGNGHKAILEGYFDRVFLLREKEVLRVAPNKGVLEVSLREK
ncbi:MAG: hypothetical protein WC629_00540 [Candidatus Paceibacterota bacterium]|jgi:hypothetical protein